MNKENIGDLFQSQFSTAPLLRETDYKSRIKKIQSVVDWIYDNRGNIKSALDKDLSKPGFETDIAEIWVSIDLAKNVINNLKEWMEPRRVSSTLPVLFSKSYIKYYPKGVCLIISPWNYPFQLCVAPLIYSIAAGNSTIIKPSESTPHCSKLVAQMASDLFDSREVAVVEGDKKEAQLLLNLPFNHIFFTGSSNIGKKILTSASAYLSSVTLELGGKSPVIIDKNYNLKTVSDRIIATKFINLGQSCIAPDYIVVHESQYQEFIDVMVDKIKISYGDGFEDQMNSDSLARIINDSHFNRLADIISKNKNSVIYGANHDIKTKFIQPTLINAETSTADLLKEEIFGPLLPIVKYNSEDDLDKILCNIDNPLALYIFSNNRKVINRVESSTSSGSVCINDIAAQFINHNLPFGGVMGSGIGRYHGFSGFKEFSNIRTITHQSKINFLNLLKAPYTNRIRKIADFLLRLYKNI